MPEGATFSTSCCARPPWPLATGQASSVSAALTGRRSSDEFKTYSVLLKEHNVLYYNSMNIAYLLTSYCHFDNIGSVHCFAGNPSLRDRKKSRSWSFGALRDSSSGRSASYPGSQSSQLTGTSKQFSNDSLCTSWFDQNLLPFPIHQHYRGIQGLLGGNC